MHVHRLLALDTALGGLVGGVPGVASSGCIMAGQFTGNAHSGSCSRPPPTFRQAPVSAGRQAIERTVCPPPACRSMATPIRIIDGWLVAYSRARVRMSSAGMPVCSDAHSGVYWVTRLDSSS
jgi:hypothetical protein